MITEKYIINNNLKNVIIEAMANGTSVFKHDRDLYKRVLENDEFFIDRSTAGRLCCTILSIDDSWLKKKGLELQELYNKKFTCYAQKEEYLSMLLNWNDE